MNKELEKSVQVALFALLIGLGFFKLNEMEEFFKTIESMVLSPNLMTIMFIGGAAISYFIYIFSIGYGLYQFLTGKGNINKAMIISLLCFFGFYVLMLIYNLSNTNCKFTGP